MAKKAKPVTDRAKRYRANRALPKAAGKRRCYICGNPEPRDVEHINGDESDNRPQNLAPACRSCNVSKGNTFSKAGVGVRTIQFNPGAGARNLAQYLTAARVLRGESHAMTLPAAIRLMHNTPAADRSRFAREIWDKRRERYGSTGRADSVPF